ncbi:hypothetical protein GW17_00019170 [Ensete ventricosum]|nr:hypothetical protein GW17_00019170 [Ensete ventricosum]
MEEFQEADILWPHDDRYDGDAATVPWHRRHRAPGKPTGPIKIPAKAQASFMHDDGNGNGSGTMIPPHVIVAERIAGDKMAFSVFVGNGRTLKGRDLRRVRTSVLRMTGFLER